MGMGLFGSSSSSLVNSFSNEYDGMYEHADTAQDPDPEIFRIEETLQMEDYLIAVIAYPNCTNFEGKKIIVFKDTTVEELNNMKIIDPHFLEQNKVIARFVPTDDGRFYAVKFVDSLLN